MQGWWLTRWRDNSGAGRQLKIDALFLLGSLLWAAGTSINVHSDHVLRTLREPGEEVPFRPLHADCRSQRHTVKSCNYVSYRFVPVNVCSRQHISGCSQVTRYRRGVHLV